MLRHWWMSVNKVTLVRITRSKVETVSHVRLVGAQADLGVLHFFHDDN